MRQISLIQPGQPLGHIHVSVEINIAVGGMVVAAVEIQIGLIGQVRDVDRIASRFVDIGGVGIEDRVDLPAQDILRGGQGSLHLVVDDAVDGDLTVRALCLVVPALLAENIPLPVDVGVKDGVQIDMREVFEVLVVAAGYRIDRLVRIGHGIQKGIEGSLDQFDKGVPDREVFRTAQDRVLNNMGDAGRILRRCPEGDVKDLVIVIPGQQRHPGAGLFVAQQPAVAVNIRQALMREDLIGLQLSHLFFCDLCTKKTCAIRHRSKFSFLFDIPAVDPAADLEPGHVCPDIIDDLGIGADIDAAHDLDLVSVDKAADDIFISGDGLTADGKPAVSIQACHGQGPAAFRIDDLLDAAGGLFKFVQRDFSECSCHNNLLIHW